MSTIYNKTRFFGVMLLLCICLTIFTACDFTPPEIETLEISIDYNNSVFIDELVSSVTDNEEVASIVISEISPEGAEISEDGLSAFFPYSGDYTITLTAYDINKNKATAQTTVHSLDDVAPVITLLPEHTTVECCMSISVSTQTDTLNTIYVVAEDEASAVSFSFIDVQSTSNENPDSFTFDLSNVTFSSLGEYVVTIAASDTSSNSVSASVPVTVVDSMPPTILLSKSSVSYTVGDNKPDYASLATAIDDVDGNVSDSIIIDDSAVDYKTSGTYTVTLSFSDNSGNKSSKNISLTVNGKYQSNSERTVYITNSGTKYHNEYCRFLSKSKIAITLSEAEARGYTACKTCGG